MAPPVVGAQEAKRAAVAARVATVEVATQVEATARREANSQEVRKMNKRNDWITASNGRLYLFLQVVLVTSTFTEIGNASQLDNLLNDNSSGCPSGMCYLNKSAMNQFAQANNCNPQTCGISSDACKKKSIKTGYTLLQIKQRLDKINADMENPLKSINCDNDKPNLKQLVNEMTDAFISNNVYTNSGTSTDAPLPKGINRIDNKNSQELSILGLNAGDLKDDGSDFYSSVYYNSNTNQYIIANRGTVPTQALDPFATDNSVITDIRQALGYPTTQYDTNATNLANNIKKGSNIVFTGHSLGGGLAALEATLARGKAITFDAAGLSTVTLKRDNQKNHKAKNIQNYYTSGEFLHQIQGNSLKNDLSCALENDPIKTNLALDYLAHLAGAPDKNQAMSIPLPTAMGGQNDIPLTSWEAGYYSDNQDTLDWVHNKPGITNSEKKIQPKNGTCFDDILREVTYHSMNNVIHGLNYQISQLLCA